jgi:Secretion system C-terminal sorting domain
MNYTSTRKKLNNVIRLVFLLIIVFLISTNLIFSQTNRQKKFHPKSPAVHHEVKEDNYIPVSRDNQGRSSAYNYSMSDIFTVQVNVDSNGQNIVGDAANEPSIAVNSNDHNKMVIGWRQFNTVTSNFRQNGYGYTTDGGLTWTFPGVIQPGIFRSDPVLDNDVYGNFYYNSLTDDPDYYCKVFKSSNGGSTWDGGTDAYGGDKQWMTIDKHNDPGNGNIYAFWTSFYSVCYPGFFTRSTDEGESFENCTTIPNEPSWGQLAVGPDGELYVGGTDGYSYDFLVAKSLNALDSSQTVTWNSYSVVSLGGSITYGIGPNPDGLGGQTNISVDTSDGPYHGYVYLLCSVEPNSGTDLLDVMFARSTNGGANWSSPTRINDSPGSSIYAWFGTMSVAPNGRIDAVWLDTRDHPGTNTSALYYSNSTDGGVTWSQNERLSDYFDPHIGWPNQDKMGDYFTMVSDSSGANLAWAATFNNEEDVYYSYITVNPVPVELTSFSASVAENVVTLDWSTATETNNKGFEIERKKSEAGNQNSEWQRIGFVEGHGTSTEQHNYNFKDKNLIGGKYSYRLKQVDFDGQFKYSDVVEANVNIPLEFSLDQNYPNPFNPTTTISWQSPVNGWQTLKVYDVLGREVATLVNEYRLAGKYHITFDAANLPSGVYYYRLTEGNYSSVKKMLLLK